MTDALTLRPWERADAGSLHQLVRSSIPEVGAWLPWCRADYSRDDAARWIEHSLDAWAARREFPMGVFDASCGELRGGVGLNRIDWVAKTANLGYWVGTPWTGRGIARAAARHAVEFAFARLGLEVVGILAHPDNVASRRVAAAIGATFCGIEPGRLEFRGARLDAAVYRIARGVEWSG